jgi:hypothetical protein
VSVFGTIIDDGVVEDAVVAHLKRWFSTYLAEVEDQRGLARGYYERPVASSFTVRTDFDKFPEEMLPFIVVTSPGIDDDPPKDGGGVYRPRWDIAITVFGASSENPRRMVQRMSAAIRTLLVQKPSLMDPDQPSDIDNLVRGIDWLGSRNDPVPLDEEDSRTVWANRQAFTIEVAGAMVTKAGPGIPIPDDDIPPPPPPVDPNAPIPDWETVREGGASATITKETINS